MRVLIEECGVDVETRIFDGFTPLMYAASSGDLTILKYLISKGADIE